MHCNLSKIFRQRKYELNKLFTLRQVPYAKSYKFNKNTTLHTYNLSYFI